MTIQRSAIRPDMSPVLRRMRRLGPVGDEQLRRVEGLARRGDVSEARTVLHHDTDPHPRPRYILSGWACRQRLLGDGRRQIFALLLPGDGVGICLHSRPLMQSTTVALTRLVTVDAAELLTREALAACPACVQALERAASLDEAQLLDHVVRLGRQTAYERMAHLLLELHDRLEVVGLAHESEFELPLTQETLSDVLGLSVVHTNRTLQQLRREGLIQLRSGRVRLMDVPLLTGTADYKPAYIPG